MNNNVPNPLIMEPGELKALNNDVIAALGTPLFFATPDLGRPYTQDVRGKLYEIITGLYIIYHDYGVRFLSEFLDFTIANLPGYGGSALRAHVWSVEALRGGFVHGSVPGGKHAQTLMRKVGFFFPGTSQQWPGILPNMTDQDCVTMVSKLTYSADQLVVYIRDCAANIQNDPGLLAAWKQRVMDQVTNETTAGYHGEFFDNRIVSDIVGACRDYNLPFIHYRLTVRQWLVKINDKMRNGTLSDSDELYTTLFNDIYNLYHPSTQANQVSSSDRFLAEFDVD